MSPRDVDDVLRAAFARIREADEREAPAFEGVLARRARRAPIAASSSIVPLAIAAGLALAAFGVYRAVASRPHRLTVPKEVVALSSWRPTTDVLLAAPGTQLLTHAPRFSASLIDIDPGGISR